MPEVKPNTFDLPIHLHRALRMHAASADKTVGELVVDAIGEYLEREAGELVTRELEKVSREVTTDPA